MDAIFHTIVSFCLALTIFSILWLCKKKFILKHLKIIIIIIFFSCMLGGAWAIDIIDHYRTNLTPIENLAFQFNVGVLDQPANLIKDRDDFSFNVFHNWNHLFVFCLISLPLILFIYLRNPQLAFYILLILTCFALAWSIHLYFDSFVKESWLCGQLMPQSVINSYYHS